jgi:hypothetical protein
MDMQYLLQPGSRHQLLCLRTKKRMGTAKVPFFDRYNPPMLFFSNPVGLHAFGSEGELTMSAPLIVSIPHRLGREEATRRLKAGLVRAASSVPVLQVDEERWDGDRMIFRVRALGQAASGHLDVADEHVRLEVKLPWLLQRFAEVAQIAIRNRGNLLLTKRG